MVVFRLRVIEDPESEARNPLEYLSTSLEDLHQSDGVEIVALGLRGGGPLSEDDNEEADKDEEADAESVVIMPSGPILNSEGNPFNVDFDPERISFDRHPLATIQQHPGIAGAATQTSEACSSANNPQSHVSTQPSSERPDGQPQELNEPVTETSFKQAGAEQPCDQNSQTRHGHEHEDAHDDGWRPVIDETTLVSLRFACTSLWRMVWLDQPRPLKRKRWW